MAMSVYIYVAACTHREKTKIPVSERGFRVCSPPSPPLSVTIPVESTTIFVTQGTTETHFFHFLSYPSIHRLSSQLLLSFVGRKVNKFTYRDQEVEHEEDVFDESGSTA